MIPNVEFEFILPKGLIDDRQEIHRQGVMRLATAKDEIAVARDRRVRENPTYGILVRLARVITRLGTVSEIAPEALENLFTLDYQNQFRLSYPNTCFSGFRNNYILTTFLN